MTVGDRRGGGDRGGGGISDRVSVKDDDELFEEEEEIIEEEEQHDREFGGEPTNNSPYPDSSSSRSFGNHALGPRTITTPRKYVSIPTRIRAASPPSLPKISKKPYPNQKQTP
ncbi:unnamed protein product [Lactuca saligna]|uniref:Uncharacterized protein n=1 Tax=Lactuca saligna TaxID=75948 RepID=A0AA35VCS0_LACSI|nr:unnamed protein product [Lactuca saligna]